MGSQRLALASHKSLMISYNYLTLTFFYCSIDGNVTYGLWAPKRETIPYKTIVAVESLYSNIHVVKNVCTDVTWEMVLREKYPYYVGLGKSSKATCRSCSYHFSKEEPRIRFEINRKVGRCVMPACEVNVCMKLSCVRNAYKRSSNFKPRVTTCCCTF